MRAKFILALAAVSASASADIVFVPDEEFSLGLGATGTIAVDINQDGRVDIVNVANRVDAINVHINLGPDVRDRINFEKQFVLRTGSDPRSIAAGDFNGDGYIDLAATSFEDDNIYVYLWDGDGGFVQSDVLKTRSEPVTLTAVDLDGNGYDDLIVNETGSSSIALFFSDENGFRSRHGYSTTKNLTAHAVADVNGNGLVDIVVGANRLHVMLNTGTGDFVEVQALDLGDRVLDLAVADVNSDDKVDIVVQLQNQSGFRLLINKGGNRPYDSDHPDDSDFVEKINTGTQSRRVVLDDVTGDGNVDLLFTTGSNYGFQVYEGTGYGKFINGKSYSAYIGTGSEDLSVADIDGDGRPDVIVTSASTGTAKVYRGLNELEFDQLQTFSLGITPIEPIAARLDRDGYDDIIVRDSSQPLLYLLRSDGDSGLVLSGTLSLAAPAIAVVAIDINEDGLDDIFVVESGSTSIDIYTAIGPSRYAFETSIEISGRIGSIDTGKLGSGEIFVAATDLVSNTLNIHKLENGFWQSLEKTSLGARPLQLATGDIDGNGADDVLVISEPENSRFRVFSVEDSVVEVHRIATSDPVTRARFVDVDGDRDLDIVTVSQSDSTLRVYEYADGKFSQVAIEYVTERGPVDFVSDDVDEDGDTDLVVLTAYDKRAGVIYRHESSYLTHGNYMDLASAPSTATLADLNGDGRMEVIIALPAVGMLAIMERSENEKPVARDLFFAMDDDDDYIEEFLKGTDPNNDDLTYVIERLPAFGKVELLDPTRGFFRYEVGAGFDETDNFTYRVHDGLLASEEAVVSVRREDNGGGALSPLWLLFALFSVVRRRIPGGVQ